MMAQNNAAAGGRVFLTSPTGQLSLVAPGAQTQPLILGGVTNANLAATAGVEYTLIEDSGGGYLQLASEQHPAVLGSAGLVFQAEELSEVLSDVGQPSSIAVATPQSVAVTPATAPTSASVLQQSVLSQIPAAIKSEPHEKVKVQKPRGNGPFKCEKCGQVLNTWALYSRHLKTHTDDKRFKCQHCSASFNVEKNLTLHVAVHEVDTTGLVCPECHRKFSRVASFRSHLTIHQEEDHLTCEECEAEYTTETKLNEHILKEHNVITDPPVASVRKRPQISTIPGEEENDEDAEDRASIAKSNLKCRICSAAMKNAKQLSVHMQHHSRLKNVLKLKQKKKHAASRRHLKHSCKHCEKKFSKPSQLVRHERIHTGVKPFKCEICDKGFSQKCSLELHLRKHTGAKPHVCEFCKMGFSQSGNLRMHIKRCHSLESTEPLLKCDECSCTFSKVGSLNAHVSRVHAAPKMSTNAGSGDKVKLKPLKSEDLLSQAVESTGIVSDSSTGKSSSRTHIVLADKSADGKVNKYLVSVKMVDAKTKLHLCNYCPKEFKKPSDLCRHMRVHTLNKPFNCKLCSRSFAMKSTLQAHMRIHTGPKEHLCKICLRRFSTLGSIKAHMRMHASIAKNKKAVRDETKAKDLEKVNLGEPLVVTDQGVLPTAPRHRAVYNPTRKELHERRFRCSSCTAVFKRSTHLKAHLHRHTGEKPFQCNLCQKHFVTRGTLNGHMKTHAQDQQVFQCTACPLTFTTKASVKRHVMGAHKKERPFLCPYCQKTFKTSVLCKKHMKVHRGDLVTKDEAATNSAPDKTSSDRKVLSTIEAMDVARPTTATTSVTTNPMYFTADSSGTVTIPTITSLTGQSELMANIASDGTITLQQGDQLASVDLSTLQFADGTPFQLSSVMLQPPANLPQPQQQSVIPKIEAKCPNCGLLFATLKDLESHSANCGTDFDTDGAQPKSDVFYCSFKKCTSTFKSADELADHMQTYHPQAPVKEEPQPAIAKLTSTNLIAKQSRVKKTVKFKSSQPFSTSSLDPVSVSEKILEASIAEKERVSTIKSTEEIARETEGLPNKCQICMRSFKKPSDLVRHVRTHTGEKPYGCDECGKHFSVQSTLNTHKKIHKRSGGNTTNAAAKEVEEVIPTLRCHICHVSFLSKNALKTHMRIHTGAKPYICNQCGECFRTSGHRKSHIANMHAEKLPTIVDEELKDDVKPAGPGPATSSTSNYIPLTITAASLNSALEAVTNAGEPLLGATVKLQLQGYGLDNAQAQLKIDENLIAQLSKGQNIDLVINPLQAPPALDESSTQILQPSLAPPPPPTNPSVQSLVSNLEPLPKILEDANLMPSTSALICPLCEKAFASADDQVNHLLEVHKISQISESASLVLPEDVEAAASAASNERTCPTCKKVFPKPSMMRRHLRIHTGEKPFTCLVCKKSFNQKNSLQIHMKKHTGDRPYGCPFCAYAFTQKGNLKVHIQRTHADQAKLLLAQT